MGQKRANYTGARRRLRRGCQSLRRLTFGLDASLPASAAVRSRVGTVTRATSWSVRPSTTYMTICGSSVSSQATTSLLDASGAASDRRSSMSFAAPARCARCASVRDGRRRPGSAAAPLRGSGRRMSVSTGRSSIGVPTGAGDRSLRLRRTNYAVPACISASALAEHVAVVVMAQAPAARSTWRRSRSRDPVELEALARRQPVRVLGADDFDQVLRSARSRAGNSSARLSRRSSCGRLSSLSAISDRRFRRPAANRRGSAARSRSPDASTAGGRAARRPAVPARRPAPAGASGTGACRSQCGRRRRCLSGRVRSRNSMRVT